MATSSARRTTRTGTIRIAAAPDRAFGLFSPLGEKHWAVGWNPELLYPASGNPELGTVFSTQHHGEPRTIWTIISVDLRARHIAYVSMRPDTSTAFIEVRCQTESGGGTSATVSYRYTGLSEHGNEYIEAVTDVEYRNRLASWEEAISRYLEQRW